VVVIQERYYKGIMEIGLGTYLIAAHLLNALDATATSTASMGAHRSMT